MRADISDKFSWLYILLSAIIALNGVMVGAVVWLARQDRPIGLRHYEKILEKEESTEIDIKTLAKAVKDIDNRLSVLEQQPNRA
ncbi:MAG: hypothetical protein Q8K98_04995 [Bacteroidota bacterium]|nr:hypothetical protein [Bacteroidota bacterium]